MPGIYDSAKSALHFTKDLRPRGERAGPSVGHRPLGASMRVGPDPNQMEGA